MGDLIVESGYGLIAQYFVHPASIPAGGTWSEQHGLGTLGNMNPLLILGQVRNPNDSTLWHGLALGAGARLSWDINDTRIRFQNGNASPRTVRAWLMKN
jgi:hypothetical protein